MSSRVTPSSTRVTVAVLVDPPHKPQFLPDMAVAQSASVVAGRARCQARPFTKKGEIQDNLKLEVTTKRLFPRCYGDGYNAVVLDQLKAWETFLTLNIGRRENPPMPNGDVTPPECPRAKYHSQAPEALSGDPVVTSRAAETTCRSQTSSSQTAATDQELQQKLIVKIPKMGEEELKRSSSKGSNRQPRTSTPVKGARPRSAEVERMEVDTPAMQTTSRSSSASATTHPTGLQT